MARGRKTLTREEYVAAAMEFLVDHGVQSLTLKALGDKLGVAHTAIYRHFTGLDDLLGAIKEYILDVMLSPPSGGTTPRERIRDYMLRFRRLVRETPSLAITFTLTTTSGGTSNQIQVSRLMFDELEQMGLSGDALTTCYQMLESYAIGTSLYDYAGENPVRERASRYRQFCHEAFDAVSRELTRLDENNERAFEAGVDALLDACESRAQRSTTVSR